MNRENSCFMLQEESEHFDCDVSDLQKLQMVEKY